MHATQPLVGKAKSRTERHRKLRFVIGLADDGRRMSLAQFSRAGVQPGLVAELAIGVIEVTNIPDFLHSVIVRRLLEAIAVYSNAHSALITHYAAGSIAKLELWGRESERHPDLSIYLTLPPAGLKQPWDRWMPDIAVEVVSASSAKRDYEDKSDDYLAAGIKEYWIIDRIKKSGLFLTRRGDGWIENRVGRRGAWSTPLLPKFRLDLAKLFERVGRKR